MSKPVDLIVSGDQVYCQHNLESCPNCDLDFSSLNQLTKALLPINGRLPPISVTQQLSVQVNRLKEEGNKNFRSKNYAEAIKLYSLAVEFAFQRPVWESSDLAREELSVCLCNRAAAYIAIEAWVDAYVDATAVVQIRRDWPRGYYRKGRTLLGLKRYDEALETFRSGLGYDPANEEIKTGIVEAEKLIAQVQKE